MEDVKNQKQSSLCSNIDFPMQQIQKYPEETNVNSTFISVNENNEASRVFPFRATPSGNLKITPNQVRKIYSDVTRTFFQKCQLRSKRSIVVLGCFRVEEI